MRVRRRSASPRRIDLPLRSPHSGADFLFMDTPRKAIGIDFGGTTIKSAVVQDGRLIEHGETIETDQFHGSPALIDEILRVVTALRAGHPEVVAVGVGLPGF